MPMYKSPPPREPMAATQASAPTQDGGDGSGCQQAEARFVQGPGGRDEDADAGCRRGTGTAWGGGASEPVLGIRSHQPPLLAKALQLLCEVLLPQSRTVGVLGVRGLHVFFCV